MGAPAGRGMGLSTPTMFVPLSLVLLFPIHSTNSIFYLLFDLNLTRRMAPQNFAPPPGMPGMMPPPGFAPPGYPMAPPPG